MTTVVESPGRVAVAASGLGSGMAKRVLDVVVATVLLVLAAPLIAALAVTVKVTSSGPALFRQVRVGQSGRRFDILKLRTMYSGAEALVAIDCELRRAYLSNHFKVPAAVDPRLTRIGRLLRRTSLDELPQLVNVVRGDMSLVGPRPVVPAELALYGDSAVLYQGVRPGLSGYWQVHGRSAVTGADRIALDEYYLRNRSIWLDLRILARTVPAVFGARGAE
jgi:lipopolysaccharide/colanic/teichoic acid biosynthesis glycosyltransferase